MGELVDGEWVEAPERGHDSQGFHGRVGRTEGDAATCNVDHVEAQYYRLASPPGPVDKVHDARRPTPAGGDDEATTPAPSPV